MTRPTTPHDGFLIPNATDVANPILAEPDKIDFNTLANARWGVIEGCAVNESGPTGVQVSSGTAVVNGQLVTIATSTILSLSTPGTNSQFNLVVVDAGGQVKVKAGTALLDPVFPEPAADETVLASVFCAQGDPDFRNNIIDKRKLLSKALLTKIAPTEQLIRNVNGTGNHFLVTGDGKMNWEGDTLLYRSAASTLRLEDHLRIDGTLDVDGAVEVDSLAAINNIGGSNFRRGVGFPSSPHNGDLFVHTGTGAIYVWRSTEWFELAVAVPPEDPEDPPPSIIPPGTVITSLEAPGKMRPLGWLPMNGTEVVLETKQPLLFKIVALTPYMTGTAGSRTMTLPNLNRRVLLVDHAHAGKLGGPWASNDVTLTVKNMPQHDHDVGVQSGSTRVTGTVPDHVHSVNITAESGNHGHNISGGSHTHTVYDPGHEHDGARNSQGIAGGFIVTDYAGRNSIDALFNDRSHTYNVEAAWHILPNTTGVTIGTSASHSHGISGGGHDHGVTVGNNGGHNHTVHSVAGFGNSLRHHSRALHRLRLPQDMSQYGAFRFGRDSDSRIATSVVLYDEATALLPGEPMYQPVIPFYPSIVSGDSAALSATSTDVWNSYPSRCDLTWYQGDDVMVPLTIEDPADTTPDMSTEWEWVAEIRVLHSYRSTLVNTFSVTDTYTAPVGEVAGYTEVKLFLPRSENTHWGCYRWDLYSRSPLDAATFPRPPDVPEPEPWPPTDQIRTWLYGTVTIVPRVTETDFLPPPTPAVTAGTYSYPGFFVGPNGRVP